MVTTTTCNEKNSLPRIFIDEDLVIALKASGQRILVEWSGKSKSKNPEEKLLPYLDKLIDYLKGKESIIDFAKLEYMNSSTVPPIITFASKLEMNNIKSIFCYNKLSSWQELTFCAFHVVICKMKNVVIKARELK